MRQTRLYISIYLLLLVFTNACGQKELKKPSKADFVITSYNTENLFDTIDDKTVNDNEYLPSSKLKWDTKKYRKKLENIGKAIAATNTTILPEIVCLLEVENKAVIQDLINTSPLKKGNYKIIHNESRDPRGIDIALIYKSNAFKVISTKQISSIDSEGEEVSTRDLLYVCGTTQTKDTLHIFVNHWKSQVGGQQQTENKRIAQAQILRKAIDSVLHTNPKAKIIIVGDFNDTPYSKSISQTLKACNKPTPANASDLYNLMIDLSNNSEGTISFKGKWQLIDNIIISYPLLNAQKGLKATSNSAYILKEDWLLTETKHGKVLPWRTNSGAKYFGGYSDHLPVYLVLQKN